MRHAKRYHAFLQLIRDNEKNSHVGENRGCKKLGFFEKVFIGFQRCFFGFFKGFLDFSVLKTKFLHNILSVTSFSVNYNKTHRSMIKTQNQI